MGKKKRCSSETQPPTTTVDPLTPVAESPPPEILSKGLLVIDILQQGLYLTALQLIEAYVSEHKDSPHLHSLEALIRKHFAEKLVDSFDLKLMNLNQAVTSAESAREKLPNSLYFALLLVELLYERAVMTQEGWDLVIRQCKNALSIENSTDPGVDRFLEEDEMQNSSKESRIKDGKKQIMRYLHASQHQIKVDAAEMELRMKRMKAVVGDWIAKKQGEIHFSAMKDKGNAKEAKQCKDMWSSSLSAKKKKELQSVNLKDLEKLFNSLSRDDLTRHLSEAISSAKVYKTWKCWECFCGKKFGDCNMYTSHFRQSHGSTLTLLKEEIGIGNEWIANYLKGEWKPMDTDMATQFIVNQLKSEFDIACDNELAVSGENPGMARYLDCYVSDDLVFDMKERVVFNTNFSSLLVVDLCLRGRELNASDIEGIADNASAAPLPLNVGQDVNSDDFLSWLYEGLIWGDLDTWTSRRDSRRKKAKEVYQIFEEECSHLKKICKDDEMSKMQCKIKSIQVVDSYIDEIENREKGPEHVAEHCVNFLRQRHEDLEGKDDIDSIIQSEVISDVLKESLAAVGQAAPCTDQARFRECGPEDGLRVQEECLKRIDNRMRLALKSVCEKIVFKNAIVLRSAGSIQQYEMILEKISAYDYRSLIIPSLKLFFQTLLDPLLCKHDIDVIAKDLAIDDEKSKGSDGKGKKKHNKKNKKRKMENFRKPEGTNSGKNGVPVQMDREDDNLNPEVGDSVSADEVNKSIATYESMPEERSEDNRKSESEPALVVNVLGVGLKNEALDCFLNVIIQSLWHLTEFRVELMSRSIPGHEHIDQNACIFCALKEIFSALKKASADKQGEAVDPTYFRNALIAHTGSFMKGEKHDAIDCLEAILESLHGLFNSVLQPKDQAQCFTADCFVHTIFGWHHDERIFCGDCNVELWHKKSTPFSFNVNATILRMMKDTHMNSSSDELLKLVQIDEKRICDRCREQKPIYQTLQSLPHVFTVVLGWAKYDESSEDISRTLSALSTELNLSIIFQGYQPDSEYFLVSMVCFSGGGEHFICFIYNQKLEKYVLYNDTSVEVTGSWKDVVNTINLRRFQPNILFFHQKSRMKFDKTRGINELLV